MESFQKWSFGPDLHGWTLNPSITIEKQTTSGIHFRCIGHDSQIISPPLKSTLGPFVEFSITLATAADPVIVLYYGNPFSEARTVRLVVIPDGRERTYRCYLPSLSAGDCIRIDPAMDAGRFILRTLALRSVPQIPPDRWPKPAELRQKRLIGGGQYNQYGGNQTVNTRYLAANPGFIARYPYDGIVLTAPLTIGGAERSLHEVIWNTWPITSAMVEPIRKDIQRTRWQHLTDCFLNISMTDAADGKATPDFTNDADWAVVENNIRMAARICRHSNIKGFWLDTEQYANYADSNDKFPLGRDSTTVLRRRGRQWIEAAQSEKPDIQIIITFAWSPDAIEYGPLKGVIPFLDGILDGIKSPALLHHGYENTFYYGQGPGTTHVINDGRKDGYPGDRRRFAEARSNIRAWRTLSTIPDKYDRFVRTGMAAWIEDHPWNQWAGAPIGVPWSLYSNAALALAYSDCYVWVWSEHSHYAHGFEAKSGINPYIASLANATHNTDDAMPTTLSSRFDVNPMTRGWTFDFDMLKIGGRLDPGHSVDLMDTRKTPFAWDSSTKSVRVDGSLCGHLHGQRQRFTHAIRIPEKATTWMATIRFRLERFPLPAEKSIYIGIFASADPIADGIAFEIASATSYTIAGMKVKSGTRLRTGTDLQLELRSKAGHCQCWISQRGKPLSAPLRVRVPDAYLDEIGTGFDDSPSADAAPNQKCSAVWKILDIQFTATRKRT